MVFLCASKSSSKSLLSNDLGLFLEVYNFNYKIYFFVVYNYARCVRGGVATLQNNS